MAKAGKTPKETSTTRVSGQKGRPQARPAAKGAATANNKTTASPSSARVSGRKAPATRPQARPTTGAPATSVRPRSRTQTGQEPFRSTRDAMAERQRPVDGPARQTRNTNAPENRPRARPRNLVTIEQWRRLSREERRAMGLPLSEIGAQAYFRRLQAGL